MSPTGTSAPLPTLPGIPDIVFRRWSGLDELPGMAAANASMRARLGMLEPIDVEAMRHRYTHLVNSDPATDCLVVARDGMTVGYGRVEWHDLVEGGRVLDLTTVVAPGVWGLGVTDALLAWCEARAIEVAARLPSRRPTWFSDWAVAGDPELTAALRRAGYEAVRQDAEFLRPDLADLPEVVVPGGYRLRTPEPGELHAVHAMAVLAFRDHWGERDDQDQTYEDWVDDPDFRRDLVAVLWAGDDPVCEVGATLKRLPDGTVRGYVDSVSTHPGHRRRGLARAGLSEMLHRLAAAGAGSAYLGVDAENRQRAFALYEDLGFVKASGGVIYRKPVTVPGATA